LSEKLQQANELIEYCKQRLAKIEVDVDKLIKEIEAL
jgi:exonuclease VII small subunit